jgi:hypothetical protein
MATAPAKDSQADGSPQLKVPPEEQFWKHYSPHGEAPLSLAGSIALHVLSVGVLMLFAMYLVSLFYKPTRSLPVDPVRFEKLGGGGGKPGGAGGGPGIGHGAEDVGEKDKEPQTGPEDAPRRPSLSEPETAKIKEAYAPSDVRLIQKSETGKALARLDDSLRRKLSDGLNPGKGKGGRGSGGGKGTGSGTGEGPGVGAGKASLNKREKRMLRWHMRFTANTGPEYLEQLRQLGAILAFPVTEGREPKYKVVRDLKPGGKLLDEDLSKIQRIYWIDDKPRSVMDITRALGVRLPRLPARFVAFMPEELEQHLFEMERNYVEKVLKRKFDEDKIDETEFRVVHAPKGYRPELIRVTMVR